MTELVPLGHLLPDASTEDAAAFFIRRQAIQQRLRELSALAEEMLVDWFEANPGKALEIGEYVVYLGEKKSAPKPKNLYSLLDAILTHTEGDLERFAEFLSASPVKYGEVKAQMGEEAFAQHFEVKESPAVKEGKRPPKGLQVVNTKYAR